MVLDEEERAAAEFIARAGKKGKYDNAQTANELTRVWIDVASGSLPGFFSTLFPGRLPQPRETTPTKPSDSGHTTRRRGDSAD